MRYLLPLLVLACGTSGAPEAAPESDQRITPGTRLHERVLLGDDGSEISLGLWDDRAGIPCEPRKAADGQMRCLPLLDNLALHGANRRGTSVFYDEWFSDPGCTTPVAYCRAGVCDQDEPPVAVVNSAGGSEDIYQVGALHTGTLYFFDAEAGGSCEVYSGQSYLLQFGSLWSIGPAVPARLFVGLSEMIRP